MFIHEHNNFAVVERTKPNYGTVLRSALAWRVAFATYSSMEMSNHHLRSNNSIVSKNKNRE